jgi:hypothetical protein
MLMWLTTTQRAVLWARHAERLSWPKIQVLDAQISRGRGRGQRQLQNILADAEARILNRLNGTPQRARWEAARGAEPGSGHLG